MMRRFVPPLSAALLLALFAVLLFYRLLFTDRVLASGDILHYFTPYRDYAAAALRDGRIPLWNPYTFMGAPFLANPQAAALYPLHWPLSWLPATHQLYWSGAIHAWILALGGYALLRRIGIGWLAALGAGAALAGSGFYGGLLGHINQMNGAAWLPWLLWTVTPLTGSRRTGGPMEAVRRPFVSGILLFSLFTALSVLAGHTQTTYVNLFGVGAWLLVSGVGGLSVSPLRPLLKPPEPGKGWMQVAAPFVIYALGTGLGVLIAAAQLLPTLELSGLGLRSGGLSYVEMTSFSLRPLLLHWTLLPSYGLRDLSVVFGTLGYTEFVAHVGALGLLLAVVAVWAGWRSTASGGSRAPWRWPPAVQCGLFFAGLGLFLALGRWNPISYLLYHLVPGFDLFRTPARWMMLYTLGMAVLAGAGIASVRARWSSPRRSALAPPGRAKAVAAALLVPALALDLLAAAGALPHARPTAPQAVYDVRTATAHLLTEPGRRLHPAAMGRLLSMSETTYDPGDMADWRRVLRAGTRPQLSEAAFTEFVIALKSQEILAPNLSLLWRVPTVDGFDGGVLPLQRYNRFLSLLIPPEELVPDGRLREQLQSIPPARILELMDARFVITDKVRDVWFEDVYYDRQLGAVLAAGGGSPLTVAAPHGFEATAVAIVGFALSETGAGQTGASGLPLAEIALLSNGERQRVGRILVGGQTGAILAAQVGEEGPGQTTARVAFQDLESGRQEYAARFALPEATRPDALEIALVEESAPLGLAVQAITLIDERTGAFAPLLPSDRGRFRRVHSGDVKIYERVGGPGRVQLFGSVLPAASVEEAVAALRALLAQDAQPTAVVEAGADVVAAWGLAQRQRDPSQGGAGAGAPGTDSQLSLSSYAPERVVVRARSAEPGLLVLKDAYYPGWRATVNGEETPIFAANALFRGVPLPAGESEVVFSYRPQSWVNGLRASALGGALWLALATWWFAGSRTRGRRAVLLRGRIAPDV